MSEQEENQDESEVEEVTRKEPSFGDNILDLRHSFGYDCKRFFNLVLIDDNTLIFASGDYLHYFDIPTRTVTFRKTVFGGGIGFITRNEHPDFIGLLTVAENGPTPTIFIYEYPSHDVHIKLENAAKACFTCGSYNSTGELFASQAGYPDFMLTIWRWQIGHVLLRSKSFQSNVLHVHFSHFNPILLASCGLSHIKFWKMANTFTGLKLKGDLGRFGKTDFSDIYAIYMLTDENVISGCEWGNMLLWEAGLIKFEITRKGRKPCHTKPITRITMENGEVMTVGMDGYVRIWYWETVDLADPPDEDRFVEIEPIYEFKVGDCEIRGLQKIKPFDSSDFGYYAQDGNGGIWYCDLNTHDVPNKPVKLYSCHGGKVIAAQTSPVSTHLMTLGEDGKLFIFDYVKNTLLLETQFISRGRDFLWFSTKISSTGMDLVAGFEDGILRQLVLDVRNEKKVELHMVRAIKAHIGAITKLTVNPRHTCLVVSSEDKSIFIYNIKDKENNMVCLKPMGFVVLDAVVNCFNWKNDEYSTILMGCKTGEVYEYQIPGRVTDDQTFLTYNITDANKMKSTRFVSVKSRIRRDQRRERIKRRKEKKRKRKLAEVEKLKAANPGLQIDMETALADSEPEEEEEPLHIPAVPNSVLWLRYTHNGTVWTSMAGFDAGYVYELVFGYAEPYICTMIADGDECEIHSYLTIEDYLIFGLVDGKLRINRTNTNDFTDFTDYRLFTMHDSYNGIISRILSSFDGNYIFSVGHDGNIFCYNWHGPKVMVHAGPLDVVVYPIWKDIRAEDIDDPEYPSLEQEKIFAEIKRKEEAAAAHDRKVLAQIGELQVKFNDIKQELSQLDEDLMIPNRNLLLDERITKQIKDELQTELDDVRDDLAYDLEVAEVGKNKLYNHFLEKLDHVPFTVRGVTKNVQVTSFRVEKLGEEFNKIRYEIDERLRLEATKRRHIEPVLAEDKEPSIPERGEENFFFGRDPNTILPRFSKKMLRLLRRYRSRQQHEIERIYTWERMQHYKPDPNKNHPDDERKIVDAQRNLGDYKLKIGYDYEPRASENLTYKYIEVANARQEHFLILDRFNKELFHLRKRKSMLYAYIEESRKRLKQLHEFLPPTNREYLIPIREIDMNTEYPELNLKENCKPGCGIEIDDILYLEKKVDDFLPPPPAASLPSDSSTMRDKTEYSLYTSLHAFEVDELPDVSEVLKELDNYPNFSEPEFFERNEQGFAPWLSVARYQWLIDLSDEQNGIVMKVKNRINEFDKELEEMITIRCRSLYEAEFMHCYSITLNQELNILRDSEEIENQLLYNADEAMKTRNEMKAIINTKNRQIEDNKKNVDRMNEQIISVQQKFMSSCKGHKFFDFLRRIFKKKWRPVKPPKADDESSESSSSEESSSEDEDADTKSIDSTDMTTIRLDESHCPTGLERTTYELAFQLRSERHALEKILLETQKLIEQRRAEVFELQKKMKFHEEVYAQEKETLTVFRRKRQQELNKINICVVLSMDQLQHFTTDENYLDLSRAILFDANRLNALKDRVSKLNDETLETQRLHRINIVHLRRMNTDISFMRSEISRLESAIKQEMIKKFGMTINLDELEEEVLRRYVFDLETSAEEECKQIEREISRRKLELANLEEELIRETKVSAEKLNILTVLNEEKNYLLKILKAQEKNFEKWMQPHKVNFDRDVEKLTQIHKEQKETIECLEREICTLRLKSKPLQLFHDVVKGDQIQKTAEEDDGVNCPKILAPESFMQRIEPDQFTIDRIKKVVQKYFAKWFNRHASFDNIRKNAKKATRYLAQSAYTFEGKITDRILDCITQALESMMPKKYLVHMSKEELAKMFRDVLNAYDYQSSEVNTEELIGGIYQNVLTTLEHTKAVLNKTQFILLRLFEQLIELLPLDEFKSEKTTRLLMQLHDDDTHIDPRCMNVDDIVDKTVKYARENLLDGITAMPIRRLAENLYKELKAHKAGAITIKCTLDSGEKIWSSKNKYGSL